MKDIKPLSARAYTNRGGRECPVCTSANIESTTPVIDGMWGVALCTCETCGSSWTDTWKLVNYTCLNDSKWPIEMDEINAKAKAYKASLRKE